MNTERPIRETTCPRRLRLAPCRGVGLLMVALLTSLVVSACSSSSTAAPTQVPTTKPSDAIFNDEGVRGVGTTVPITYGLSGLDGTLEATLQSFVDDAPGAPPPAGATRYVAVEFSIVAQPNEAAPTPPRTKVVDLLGALTAITREDGQFPALTNVRLATGTMLSPGPITFHGSTPVTGWAVFAVPTTETMKLVNLTPNGPNGDQGGWNLLPLKPTPTPK